MSFLKELLALGMIQGEEILSCTKLKAMSCLLHWNSASNLNNNRSLKFVLFFMETLLYSNFTVLDNISYKERNVRQL